MCEYVHEISAHFHGDITRNQKSVKRERNYTQYKMSVVGCCVCRDCSANVLRLVYTRAPSFAMLGNEFPHNRP